MLCIVVPLLLRGGAPASLRGPDLRGSAPHLLYFLGIGLGFMFVEISQMQRLMVFLGHPTYALSVVLFTLRVGSGLGSAAVARLRDGSRWSDPKRVLPLTLGVLVVFGTLTPVLVRELEGATTPVRIAVAVGLLLCIGLFTQGITTAFWLGVACYVGAWLAYAVVGAAAPIGVRPLGAETAEP